MRSLRGSNQHSHSPHCKRIHFRISFKKNCFYPHLRTFFHCFLEREEERKKHQYERNMDWLPPISTRLQDRTHNTSVTGQHSNPLSHTSQN